MKSPLRTLTLAAAIVSLATVPTAAQVSAAPQARGWIGVSFESVSTDQGGGSIRTMVTVTDVIRGGPADQAGLRPGDRVITVNGRSWQDQFGAVSFTIRPGDPVHMVVERNGQRREVQVTAGTRPAGLVVAPQTWSVTVGTDSMVDRMYRAMDSLRIRLIREDDGNLAVVGERGAADSLAVVLHRIPGGNMRVRNVEPGRTVDVASGRGTFGERAPGAVLPQVRPPFSFFIFRGEAYDSLRTEMDALNQEIRELRSRQAARTRELARQAHDGRIDGNDQELARLVAEMREVDARASALRAAMEEEARRGADPRWGTRWFTAPEAPATVTPVSEAEMVRARPLAPYVLGQNRAAGAEVVDLRPELAAYFQVKGGVLVVDVPEGTPAAQAGMQPGDVIVRVDDLEIRSIPDLREGLARSAPPIPLTLVRKGNQIQLLLRR